MTFQTNKRPILQVDRLIFDPRQKIKPKLIPSTETKQYSIESHIFLPTEKLKIVRLTMEDFNKKKSSKIQQIKSPIYESIDERLC